MYYVFLFYTYIITNFFIKFKLSHFNEIVIMRLFLRKPEIFMQAKAIATS